MDLDKASWLHRNLASRCLDFGAARSEMQFFCSEKLTYSSLVFWYETFELLFVSKLSHNEILNYTLI